MGGSVFFCDGAHYPCRSEQAREKRPDNVGIQAAHVIVNDHREQARSYIQETRRD